MRSNWWRWLWGTIPLLLLGWLAVEAEHKRIERDLHERTLGEFTKAGLAWAQASFQGRDGVLSGKAADVADPDKAYEIARNVWGVRIADNKSELIDQVENYHWGVSRLNNRVRLSGYVPNAQARSYILGVARASFPGFEIQDRMKLGRGAPNQDTWLGGITFALKQLTYLKRGDARLEVLNLSLSGEAEDAGAYRTLSSLANGLPKGIKLSGAAITAPVVTPHVWTARFDGAAMNFKGFVPSDVLRADLLAAAREKLSETAVTDDTEPGNGVAQGWGETALIAVRQLRRLENGSAEIRDGQLTVTGVAHDDAALEAVRSALKAVPASYKLAETLSVKPKPKPAEPAPAPVAPAAPTPEPEKKATPAAPPAPTARVELPAVAPVPPVSPPQAAPQAPAPSPAPKLPEVVAMPPLPPPPPLPSALMPPATLTPQAPPALPATAALPQPKPAPQEVQAAQSCQDTLRSVAAGGALLFRYGSADLMPDSSGTLDKLATAARACPNMLIEIAGHASAEGEPQANLRLSQSRAQSVLNYLVKAGVDARQLEARGYGIEKPVAPNTSSANMAKNRRIDFSVRPAATAGK